MDWSRPNHGFSKSIHCHFQCGGQADEMVPPLLLLRLQNWGLWNALGWWNRGSGDAQSTAFKSERFVITRSSFSSLKIGTLFFRKWNFGFGNWILGPLSGKKGRLSESIFWKFGRFEHLESKFVDSRNEGFHQMPKPRPRKPSQLGIQRMVSQRGKIKNLITKSIHQLFLGFRTSSDFEWDLPRTRGQLHDVSGAEGVHGQLLLLQVPRSRHGRS